MGKKPGFVLVSLLCILSIVIVWCSNSMIAIQRAMQGARARKEYQQQVHSCEALARYGIDFCVKEYGHLAREHQEVVLTFDQWPLHSALTAVGKVILIARVDHIELHASIMSKARTMRVSCAVRKKGDAFFIERWAYA